jgi:hypothetical protein
MELPMPLSLYMQQKSGPGPRGILNKLKAADIRFLKSMTNMIQKGNKVTEMQYDF